MNKDPRVDAYIAKAAAFAQPLLIEMRKRAHQACPAATETIKWNVPFYELNGKLIASMAAFKAHTKFGVWQDMKPHMVDVSEPAELPPAADWNRRLKAAAEHAQSAGGQKTSAKKTTAKKTSAKKTVAKKANKKSASKKASSRAK
ncbi:MAG: DUF1801 domain-containing protein [Myxococcales bacterium]